MGAGEFHGRVRDGIGCISPAMATGPPSRKSLTDGVVRGFGEVRCECGLVLRAVFGFGAGPRCVG